MLHIAICDDEQVIAYQIEEMLIAISGREGLIIDTDVYGSGEELEKKIDKGIKYDLIYFDIQMEHGDGIKAAKFLRQYDETALIVYISGYDRYMMELFRLDVFDFLKKPIDAALFENTFLAANRKICNKLAYFTFQYKNQEYKLFCMDILYLESIGRQTIVYLKNGETERYNGKLSDAGKQLANGKIPFLRIHQSYLVNYYHIRSRSKAEIVLTNGKFLPISEDRQKQFGISYGKLLGGELDV